MPIKRTLDGYKEAEDCCGLTEELLGKVLVTELKNGRTLAKFIMNPNIN